jgi:hypothetical protein
VLSDNMGLVELFEEFLSFLFNIKERTPIIYQDCTLVIDLVRIRGGGGSVNEALEGKDEC